MESDLDLLLQIGVLHEGELLHKLTPKFQIVLIWKIQVLVRLLKVVWTLIGVPEA